MPRKQYAADLAQAIISHGVDFIHDLCAGEDDGQIKFLFVHSALQQPVSVVAGVTGVLCHGLSYLLVTLLI